MAFALGLGWELACRFFGRWYADVLDLGWFCFPLGACLAAVFRRFGGQWKAATTGAFVTGASSAVVASCLHFATPSPHWRFLGEHRRLMSLDPGSPGLLWSVYSFRGDPLQVSSAARSELLPRGYQEEWSSKGHYFQTGRPSYGSVSVEPGRAVGKHWAIDGHFLDVDYQAKGWVTVGVVEPDPFPFWLRNFVP